MRIQNPPEPPAPETWTRCPISCGTSLTDQPLTSPLPLSGLHGLPPIATARIVDDAQVQVEQPARSERRLPAGGASDGSSQEMIRSGYLPYRSHDRLMVVEPVRGRGRSTVWDFVPQPQPTERRGCTWVVMQQGSGSFKADRTCPMTCIEPSGTARGRSFNPWDLDSQGRASTGLQRQGSFMPRAW